MKIIYRISDTGYNKIKPNYIGNEQCLANAVKTFGSENFIIIADNISDDTFHMIRKYVAKQITKWVSVGHGAGTFNMALDEALKYHDNE
jgi:hypothetical protein